MADSTHNFQIYIEQLRRGGQQAYIVLRIVRLWQCIIPPTNRFDGIEFVAVDAEGSAIHGCIPADLATDFQPLLFEGRIYRIELFDIVRILPEIFFSFASYRQVMERSRDFYHLTDIVGLLQSASDVTEVILSDNRGTVSKMDLFIVLISGETVQVTLWGAKTYDLDIPSIILLGTKPIIAVAGLHINNCRGHKQINSCSATKFYINPDIPETFQLRLRYRCDGYPINLIPSATIDNSMDFRYPYALRSTIKEHLLMNPAIIKGIKFKVFGRVTRLLSGNGWFYYSCNECTRGVSQLDGGYRCSIHGITNPRFNLRLSLVIEHCEFRLHTTVFGLLAHKLTGIDVTMLDFSERMDFKRIPLAAESVLGTEHDFTVGVLNQSYGPALVFKIFSFDHPATNGSSCL